MGRTACTEPQCLYKGALYLTVELYLYSPYGPYGLYKASMPVHGWPLPVCLWTGLSWWFHADEQHKHCMNQMVVHKKQLEIPLMMGLWEPETCGVEKEINTQYKDLHPLVTLLQYVTGHTWQVLRNWFWHIQATTHFNSADSILHLHTQNKYSCRL